MYIFSKHCKQFFSGLLLMWLSLLQSNMGLVSIDSSFPEVYKKPIIFKVQRELRELFVSLKHTIQKAFLDAIFRIPWKDSYLS